jgi:hypothetical protein
MDLVKGQKLWLVDYAPYRLSEKGEVVGVTKVGKKFAELDNGMRVNVNTMLVDNKAFGKVSRCYLSKEDHDNEIAIVMEWRLFMRACSNKYHFDGLTVENIQKAYQLLGLERPKDA